MEPIEIHCSDWKYVDGKPADVSTRITATVAGVTSDVLSEFAYLPLGDPTDAFNVLLSIFVTEPCGSVHEVQRNISVRSFRC